MTILRTTAALGLVLVLAGCGDQGSSDGDLRGAPGTDQVPAGTTYVVTGVTDAGEDRPLVAGTEIRLRFDEDNRFGISAGCNSMGGTYSLDGTRLTVTDLATTDMGCDQDRMEQDTWVAALFGEPVQFSTGANASVISGDTVLALTDREVAAPDKPLVGTSWELDTIIDGETSSSVPEHGSGSIEFNKYGGFRTAVRCGTSSGGKVTVEGNRLTFAPNMGGIADCVPGDGVDSDEFYAGPQAVEQIFGKVLVNGATFSIEENRLTITFGDHAAGFTAED